MSKKVLAMPDGNWLSHTSRTLEIAKALRAIGHEVVFASDGEYMKLPREEGFPVESIINISPEQSLARARSGRANWYDYKQIKKSVAAELALFDRVKPDLVLADFRLPISTSCELARIPLAVILNASWTNYYSADMRAPEHFVLTKLFGRKLLKPFVPWLIETITAYDARPFNQFRNKRSLEPFRNIFDVWKGDLNLIVDIPEYGPTENLPEDYHYIGPIIWEPKMQSPQWLDALDPQRPTLYFTMGSTGHSRFFEQAIDIYGNTDYQCIMTTAGLADIQHVPNNFFIEEYAPGSKIMQKSDLVICQGGNGTIYQAMAAGVPIIGIPTMHDQEWNLDRVVNLGIGIHLSELHFEPAHLKEAVEEVLRNGSYKNKARKYKSVLDGYDGPRMGANLIDAFFQQQPSVFPFNVQNS